MKLFATITTAAGCAALLAATPAAHAESLLQYNFDETGNTALATGSAADADGNPVLNITGSGAARGEAGSGVSGQADDRAFDNTNSSGIFGGGRAQADGDFDAIDGLSAFTVSGWFKLPDTATNSIGAQAGLIENFNSQVANPPQAGFSITGGERSDSGSLRLRVNGVDDVETDSGTYDEIGEYVNFAVTYDSEAGEVNFYKGLVDEEVSLVGTFDYDKGAVLDESQPLVLGVRKEGSSLTFSNFNGLIDDVRIYDGVTDLDTLEAARLSDLRQVATAVPTPSAALGGVAMLGGMLLRRRRRSA